MQHIIREIQYIQSKLEKNQDLIEALSLLNKLTENIIKTIQITQTETRSKASLSSSPTGNTIPPKPDSKIFIHSPEQRMDNILHNAPKPLSNPTEKTRSDILSEPSLSTPKHPYESVKENKNSDNYKANTKSILDHLINPTRTTEKTEKRTNINEKMKNEIPVALSDYLHNRPISNLKSSMNLNERFLFLHELFRNDTQGFEKTLQILTNCQSLNEAETFLQSEIIPVYEWNLESETVILFLQLLRRRFS